jgi:hypothetical protein
MPIIAGGLFDKLGAIVLAGGAAALIVQAIRGKEFCLYALGGGRSARIPKWLGRPLLFLAGIGCALLALGLWRQG